MGVPVVMSDVGGAREMFPAGSSGTVYPRDDIESLISALEKTLRNVQSGSLSKHDTRIDVLRRFSLSAMDAAWTNVIWQCDQNNSSERVTLYPDCGG